MCYLFLHAYIIIYLVYIILNIRSIIFHFILVVKSIFIMPMWLAIRILGNCCILFEAVSDHQGFPSGSADKEPSCSAGDTGYMCLIHESGRSSGGGSGNPLQYSCLENPMDRGAWRAAVQGITRSWLQLSTYAYYILDNPVVSIHIPCICLLRIKFRSRIPSLSDMNIVRGLVLHQHVAYSKSCLWLSFQGWWMNTSGLPTNSNAFSFLNNTFI